MFPIGDDDNTRRTMPVVTYALIALNILVFFIELNGGDAFVQQWAFIPSRFFLEAIDADNGPDRASQA